MACYEITPQRLSEIAKEQGLPYAEFCVSQAESQLGSAYARPLWDELGRLQDEWFHSDDQ